MFSSRFMSEDEATGILMGHLDGRTPGRAALHLLRAWAAQALLDPMPRDRDPGHAAAQDGSVPQQRPPVP
jgi:hypothetical protein